MRDKEWCVCVWAAVWIYTDCEISALKRKETQDDEVVYHIYWKISSSYKSRQMHVENELHATLSYPRLFYISVF